MSRSSSVRRRAQNGATRTCQASWSRSASRSRAVAGSAISASRTRRRASSSTVLRQRRSSRATCSGAVARISASWSRRRGRAVVGGGVRKSGMKPRSGWTASRGARSRPAARRQPSRRHGSCSAGERSWTNVRTAAFVSQTGEQAKRTASRSSRARIANTVTPRKIRACANHSPAARPPPTLVAMSQERGQRVGYGVVFASREMRALVTGQFVSVAGTSIAAVALTILVYERTESPLLSSLAFALGFVPYLVGGGLFSGVVDRIRPRRLVVRFDLGAAVLAGAMALPGLPVGALFALLLAIGTLSSVEGGARASLVRASGAADAYVPARSLQRVSAQLAQIAGTAADGLLLLGLTPRGALLVNAASFAFSAATARLGIADHPNTGQRPTAALLRDSLGGVRRLLARPELRRLLLLGWLTPMFAVAPEALAAPYVAGGHGSPALVGWWLVALPAGLVAGDVAGVRWLDARRQRRLVGPAAAASFLPYLAFVARPPIALALALLFVSGACGLYALGLDARVRDAVPDHLFARAMALNTAGLMTLQGIGFAMAGAVAEL